MNCKGCETKAHIHNQKECVWKQLCEEKEKQEAFQSRMRPVKTIIKRS